MRESNSSEQISQAESRKVHHVYVRCMCGLTQHGVKLQRRRQ